MNSAQKLKDLALAEGAPGAGWMQLRVESPAGMDVFLAVRHPEGTPALVVETSVEDVPNGWKLSEVRGLQIHRGAGDHRSFRLVIAVSQATFWDPFVAVADDILAAVANAAGSSSGLRAIAQRLEIWARFFDRTSLGYMGREERLGLLGELYVFDRYLLPCLGESAVDAWRGPSGDPHDFVIGTSAIEVKCTTTQQPTRLEVSSARQLDDDAFLSLFLFAVRVVEGPTGELSLPELVDAVRSRLQASRARFEDQLLQAGYSDVHREHYLAERYKVKEDAFFHVGEGFPRLLESSLPLGVGNVRYTIDWAACKPFEVPSAQVLEVR